jgi:hypothetical protein
MKSTHIAFGVSGLLGAALVLHAQHPLYDSGAKDEMDHATTAMDREGKGHKHDMGPHMQLTPLRTPSKPDEQRAREIVEAAKQAVEKYHDPAAAEKDGFRKFLPNVKQKMYHYTHYGYALQAGFGFDPAKPTSLLYEAGKNGKLKLIGVMYTAPARYTEEQLNERIPLSMAQWHLHTNLCIPPKDQRGEMFKPNARFGLAGSISTKEACDAAGGTFRPRIFGWMVHMYPWEKSMDEIWSVERQKDPLEPPAAAHKH